MWHGKNEVHVYWVFIWTQSKVIYVSNVSQFPIETKRHASYLLLSLQHHFLHSHFLCCVLFSNDVIWDMKFLENYNHP